MYVQAIAGVCPGRSAGNDATKGCGQVPAFACEVSTRSLRSRLNHRPPLAALAAQPPSVVEPGGALAPRWWNRHVAALAAQPPCRWLSPEARWRRWCRSLVRGDGTRSRWGFDTLAALAAQPPISVVEPGGALAPTVSKPLSGAMGPITMGFRHARCARGSTTGRTLAALAAQPPRPALAGLDHGAHARCARGSTTGRTLAALAAQAPGSERASLGRVRSFTPCFPPRWTS